MQSSQFCIALCFLLFACGERLIGKLPQDTKFYYFVKKHARLQIQQHCKTNATGVYEVRGYLFIQFPYWYGGDPPQRDYRNHAGSRAKNSALGSLRFWLKGMWSDKSRQLMMVGSASWTVAGKPIILDAVLHLNYTAKNNPTLYNGYISGTLKSMVSAIDPDYFDPFSIFSFPSLPNYNYSLLSRVYGGAHLSEFDVPRNQWPTLEGSKYCWLIMGESLEMEVEYAAECNEHHQLCSPFSVRSLPHVLLLTPFQCSAGERKLRYIATFQNTKYEQGFGLNSTVIGEAVWDDEKKELFGIACPLLDPLNRSANEVGDCTMRLSMRYTSIFTIRNEPKLVGRFRSTKHADKSGYFRKMNLTKSDEIGLLINLPNVRYEYTKLDEARKSCTTKKPTKKGNTYPDVYSDNMRFDLAVENSKGQHIAWVSAFPLWVGNDSYQKKNTISVMQKSGGEPSHSNISYLISLGSSSEIEFGHLFQSLNWSANLYNEVEIIAEGVYNAENGCLYMVGCRKLEQYGKISTYIDCEILITLDFDPLTGERGGGRIKGAITSTGGESDPLHFNDMIINSATYYVVEAVHAMQRMNMEIVMVLISNTLVCIFAALQIIHVKRYYSKVPLFVSLYMLVIMCVGHMMPLVFNFEDVHLWRYPVTDIKAIGIGGRLESNEVAVRLSSLVALLLQLRLLQLVWTAKQRDERGNNSLWIGERKAGYVLLGLYAAGGLLALLLNCTRKARAPQVRSKYIAGENYSVWGVLMSYGGLIMDGFLFPQVVLNAIMGSAERALCCSFYGGISAVRVAPHAYNLYRVRYYPAFDLNKTYYYANPDVGFYSRAWDVVVPFGIITLAAIVFLQQRRRDRRLAF